MVRHEVCTQRVDFGAANLDPNTSGVVILGVVRQEQGVKGRDSTRALRSDSQGGKATWWSRDLLCALAS